MPVTVHRADGSFAALPDGYGATEKDGVLTVQRVAPLPEPQPGEPFPQMESRPDEVFGVGEWQRADVNGREIRPSRTT